MLPDKPDKMWDEMERDERDELFDNTIAKILSKPEELRPSNKKIYETWGIPERTFYYRTEKADFAKSIVAFTLNKAKKDIPEVIATLQKRATQEGSDRAIEMYLKYVAEVSEKYDHTTKGDKMKTQPLVIPDSLAEKYDITEE